MKIKEVLQETASSGGTSSGCIATVNSPGSSPPKGQFFGGNPAASIYSRVQLNRKKRREKNNEKTNI